MAFFVATWFAVVGVAWVLVTHAEQDWLFVGVSTVALYAVARTAASKLGRAYATLSAIVASIGDGLLLLGRDGRIEYANAAAVRMLEVPSARDLVGMTAPEFSRRFFVTYQRSGALIRPEDFAAQRAFDQADPIRYKAVIHPDLKRELVVLTTAAGVRTTPEERAEVVVSILHDITDSQKLDTLFDRFFAAAAHALKTPVAIIQANVQHISPLVPESLLPSLRTMQRQCDRIDRLVLNLLVVSRARSKTLQLHTRVVELAPLVESVVAEVSARGTRIRSEIVATPHVRADRERIELVVRDLVFNAIGAATPTAEITLRLEATPGEVELSVHYPALAVAERTFVGVEEYDDSTLSRCAIETIVDAHGGSHGATEQDGDATIWIRLPSLERAE